MSYKINRDEYEPAMLYESIACHAFNCSRLGDPGEIADATFFDFNFVPPLTEEGLNAMYSIIDQLIKIEKINSKITEYTTIRESLTLGMDQDNSIELLGLLADIINE